MRFVVTSSEVYVFYVDSNGDHKPKIFIDIILRHGIDQKLATPPSIKYALKYAVETPSSTQTHPSSNNDD